MTINGGLWWWQPTGELTAQVGWLGLRVGGRLALSLMHLLHEPSELSQWIFLDNGAINIEILTWLLLLLSYLAPTNKKPAG